MNQAQIDVGDAVRITAGPYKDAEGVVEDRQPECDAVRVHTKEGTAYGFLEAMMRLPVKTPKALQPRRNPLQK
jgi:hypothetical protein